MELISMCGLFDLLFLNLSTLSLILDNFSFVFVPFSISVGSCFTLKLKCQTKQRGEKQQQMVGNSLNDSFFFGGYFLCVITQLFVR